MANHGVYTGIYPRFFNKFKIEPYPGCWNWTGNKTHGYGNFYLRKKQEKAHRISYQHYIGEIPKGLQVCHKCDNPGCVNPFHLFLGTQLMNIHDMIAKGRRKTVLNKNTHLLKHPSIAAYRVRGCRCDECRALKRIESQRLYKPKRNKR